MWARYDSLHGHLVTDDAYLWQIAFINDLVEVPTALVLEDGENGEFLVWATYSDRPYLAGTAYEYLGRAEEATLREQHSF